MAYTGNEMNLENLEIPEYDATVIGIQILPTVDTTQLLRPLDTNGVTLMDAFSGQRQDYHALTINHETSGTMIKGEEELYRTRQGVASYNVTITILISATVKKLTPSGETITFTDVELATISAKSHEVELLSGQEYMTPEQFADLPLQSTDITYSNVMFNKDGVIMSIDNVHGRSYLLDTDHTILQPAAISLAVKEINTKLNLHTGSGPTAFDTATATVNGAVDKIRGATQATYASQQTHTVSVHSLPRLIPHENPATSIFSLNTFNAPNIQLSIDGRNSCDMLHVIGNALQQNNLIGGAMHLPAATIVDIKPFRRFESVEDLVSSKVTTNMEGLSVNTYQGISGIADTGVAEKETAAVEELSKYISNIVQTFGMNNSTINIIKDQMGALDVQVSDIGSVTYTLSGTSGIGALVSFHPGLFEQGYLQRLNTERYMSISSAIRNGVESALAIFASFKLTITVTDIMLFELTKSSLSGTEDKYQFVYSHKFIGNNSLVTTASNTDVYFDNVARSVTRSLA